MMVRRKKSTGAAKKPSKRVVKLARKYKVKITIKRGSRRVYKTTKLILQQIRRKKKSTTRKIRKTNKFGGFFDYLIGGPRGPVGAAARQRPQSPVPYYTTGYPLPPIAPPVYYQNLPPQYPVQNMNPQQISQSPETIMELRDKQLRENDIKYPKPSGEDKLRNEANQLRIIAISSCTMNNSDGKNCSPSKVKQINYETESNIKYGLTNYKKIFENQGEYEAEQFISEYVLKLPNPLYQTSGTVNRELKEIVDKYNKSDTVVMNRNLKPNKSPLPPIKSNNKTVSPNDIELLPKQDTISPENKRKIDDLSTTYINIMTKTLIEYQTEKKSLDRSITPGSERYNSSLEIIKGKINRNRQSLLNDITKKSFKIF